ncbi:MAG: hypothetical protein KIH64_013325 [Mycobacterium sp.]|nr:hypothetical protein [Mycobacterium sp.]
MTDVVADEVDEVAFGATLLAAICGSDNAESSRRIAPAMTAHAVSPGTHRPPSSRAVDSADAKFLTTPTGTPATGGDTTRTAAGASGSVAVGPTAFAGGASISVGLIWAVDLMAAPTAAGTASAGWLSATRRAAAGNADARFGGLALAALGSGLLFRVTALGADALPRP